MCDELMQQVQAATPDLFDMPGADSDLPAQPKIDVAIKKIQDVGDVTGIDADEEPDGSVKATIEDVEKPKT